MRLLLVLAVSGLLIGCETAGSEAGCRGRVVRYTADRMARVAAEVDAAPAGAEWPSFVADYGELRAFCSPR